MYQNEKCPVCGDRLTVSLGNICYMSDGSRVELWECPNKCDRLHKATKNRTVAYKINPDGGVDTDITPPHEFLTEPEEPSNPTILKRLLGKLRSLLG